MTALKQFFTCELVNDDFVSIFRGLFRTQQAAADAAKVYRSLGWRVQIQVIKYEAIDVFTITKES